MALLGSEQSGLGSIPTAAGDDSPGEGPAAATLAAVYAAGAGAPITDDLMAMLHGNMRFQSAVDSNPLPLLGYFEDASGQATASSGFPSELWSLAVIVGTDTGRRFSVFQMFDPAWNGTFAAINGMSWETERVTFTSDPANQYKPQNLNPAYASRDWKILNNWAPAAYPQGTSAHGTVSHEVELYNTIDLGLRFIDQMDGWGQTNRELTPQQNGITWRDVTHWNAANIVGAANDGFGWGVYSGILNQFNHIVGGLTCRQVTGDPLGDWYWSFFVPDGSGGLLDVADFAKSGLTFNVPVTFPTTSGQPQLSYSIDLDMMTVGAGGTVVPARAGQAFVCVRYTNMVVSVTGTCTGAPTFDTGAVGPSFNEIFANATQLSAAQINLGPGQQVSNNITGYHSTSSAGIKVAVHTAATGTTQLTVRQTYYGFWTAL